MSITDELRKYAGIFYLFRYKDVREKLDAIADRIDAEHQKAEDEWKAKNGDMWLKGYAVCHEELMEGHPVIAADLEKAGWVRLPVDADGEVIHIGDRVENNERVVRIVLTDGSWEPSVYVEKLPNVLHEHFCDEISHYHEPTVEDKLWELIDALGIDRDKCSPVMVENAARELQLREGA